MKEQMPINIKEQELYNASLKLEKMNKMTENATDDTLKEGVIFKADKLNKQLEILEQESGLSQEQIMENYEKLNKRIAEGIINKLIKEISLEKQEQILSDINIGIFNGLINAVKQTNPHKVALAVSCAMLLIGGVVMVSEVEAGSYYNSEQYKQETRNVLQDVKNMEAQIEIYRALLNVYSKYPDDFVITKTVGGQITVGYAKNEVQRLSLELQELKRINPWVKNGIQEPHNRHEWEQEEIIQSRKNKKLRDKLFGR